MNINYLNLNLHTRIYFGIQNMSGPQFTYYYDVYKIHPVPNLHQKLKMRRNLQRPVL